MPQSTNKWRQDTCITMTPGTPASCKVELWAGNDHAQGSSVGTTYTFTPNINGNCTYAPSMVPAITHPRQLCYRCACQSDVL